MTRLTLPPTTVAPDQSAVLVLIDSAEFHRLIDAPDAAYLRAAVWAVADRAEQARSLTYRGLALRVLARARRDWEPDDHGRPVLDGEVGQVMYYLARPQPVGQPRHHEHAWALLCGAVDEIHGVVCGGLDPVDILGPGVPGTVEAKTELVLTDAERDVRRGVAHLLRQADPRTVLSEVTGRRALAGVSGR